MMQTGFFDWHERFEKLNRNGDPLLKLNQVVDWEIFRKPLDKIRQKERKSNAGAKPYDVVRMFKVLIIQSLYNLSDDRIEFQILDRISFMRFLDLGLGDRVPDAKTIWLFREQITEAGLIKPLFDQFDACLRESGFLAQKGQIIDASIVEAPRQRNSREENQQIKQGDIPEGWNEATRRQKDTDARWTKKNGQSHYGYKNHICVDIKHKLIRDYDVTDAAVHDSQVFDQLIDESNSSRDVYADSAYRSEESVNRLKERGFREHLQRKGCRHRKLTEREQRGNRTRARKRSRVEHVFGVQAMMAGGLILRTIGVIRARAKIGLLNLAYNINRYSMLGETG
jgi:transposase, IS5 family